MLFFLLLLLKSAGALHVTPDHHGGDTVVELSYGTFRGTSLFGADSFLGIPFAKATRFGLPQFPSKVSGIQDASAFGPACPQQSGTLPNIPGFPPLGPNSSNLITSEDCLFINVIRPSNLPAHRKLPVVFWIYGGGFEDGDTSQYNGTTVVARSVALGEPIIYVSANYRLNAFGFLASKEVKMAGIGNLGLRDQRFALQWVHRNIALFGGDPSKVTIWGQSAGAFSVGLQMLANGGHPGGLFRGAFMESGAPIPLPDISEGQVYYDQLVADTNCTSAADTFACLKAVPLEQFQHAVDQSPNIGSFKSLQLAWQPRLDGTFLSVNPMTAIANGAYAKIPMVIGNVDDEGTLFSLSQLNLTTDQEATAYLHENYLPHVSDAQFQPVADLYPSDPAQVTEVSNPWGFMIDCQITQGSPFDTGTNNQLSPEYKRLAAVQGDLVFQAPRRFFLRSASKTQNTWAFLYKRGKATPFIGSSHASDLPEFYGSISSFQGTDALVNFVNNLDPNVGSGTIPANVSTLISWPKYGSNGTDPPLLTFLDPNVLTISPDTYRGAAMEVLTNLTSLSF